MVAVWEMASLPIIRLMYSDNISRNSVKFKIHSGKRLKKRGSHGILM